MNLNKSLTFDQGSRTKGSRLLEKNTKSIISTARCSGRCFLVGSVRPSNPLLAFESVVVLLSSVMVLFSHIIVNVTNFASRKANQALSALGTDLHRHQRGGNT